MLPSKEDRALSGEVEQAGLALALDLVECIFPANRPQKNKGLKVTLDSGADTAVNRGGHGPHATHVSANNGGFLSFLLICEVETQGAGLPGTCPEPCAQNCSISGLINAVT